MAYLPPAMGGKVVGFNSSPYQVGDVQWINGAKAIWNGSRFVLEKDYLRPDATPIEKATSAGAAQKAYADAAMPDSLKAMLSGLSSGGFGGSSSGTPSANGNGITTNGGFPGGTGSVGTSSTIPTIAPPDNTAARNAIYAQAKDTAGKAGRASIDALRGELGATGMLGGGAEGQLVSNAVENALGETNQVTRDQAAKEADQAADFAKAGYAGAITQRGQDVSAREAEARLATERQLQESQQSFQQAQLKSQQQLQLLSLALGGLKSLY